MSSWNNKHIPFKKKNNKLVTALSAIFFLFINSSNFWASPSFAYCLASCSNAIVSVLTATKYATIYYKEYKPVNNK